MYLRSGEIIEATPSEQSVRFITTRTTAVWKAVERACATDDFRPRPSALCAFCASSAGARRSAAIPTLAAVEATAPCYGHSVAA